MIAAAGQAFGVVLAKFGLGNNFPALSGNVIRMSAAFLALWLVTVIQGQVISTVQQANYQRSGLLYILGGAVFWTFGRSFIIIVCHSKYQYRYRQHDNRLTPIFLLPVSYFILKEKISWQAVTGTLTAIAGVGLLFWL